MTKRHDGVNPCSAVSFVDAAHGDRGQRRPPGPESSRNGYLVEADGFTLLIDPGYGVTPLAIDVLPPTMPKRLPPLLGSS